MVPVIRDARTLADIRTEWGVVRRFASLPSHREYLIPGSAVVTERPTPEDFYNLPLVLAYGILQRVLQALVDQGVVLLVVPKKRKNQARSRTKKQARGPSLDALMQASQAALPWQDYSRVDQGRKDRNYLAHEAKLFSRDYCVSVVDAIEAELRAWRIVIC